MATAVAASGGSGIVTAAGLGLGSGLRAQASGRFGGVGDGTGGAFEAGGGSGGSGSGSGSGSGWGKVPFTDLEAERQSRDAFKLEADRAKAGGMTSGTRAVTWNMQVGRGVNGTGKGLPWPVFRWKCLWVFVGGGRARDVRVTAGRRGCFWVDSEIVNGLFVYRRSLGSKNCCSLWIDGEILDRSCSSSVAAASGANRSPYRPPFRCW